MSSWKGKDYYAIGGIPVVINSGVQPYTLEQIYALRGRFMAEPEPEPEPTGRFRHLDWEDEIYARGRSIAEPTGRFRHLDWEDEL